jgi:hypothetical protein
MMHKEDPRMRIGTPILSALLLALAALPATAITKEQTAIAGAKLGAATADVKKIFPKMEVTTENLGAQPFDSEHLTRYVVKDFRVPQTGKPGTLELRFWDDKLWAYIVYYGEGNDEKVIKAFTKDMGPPNGTNPQKPGWQGDTSLTFVETDKHWYSVTDNALSKAAQTWFYAQIEKMKQGLANSAAQAAKPAAAATAATTPAATPAGTPAK